MERQTVLIVDDSELNRMMLMEILGEQYHYIEAQNGREAVRLMEKKLTVDLMLLDINMLEMNGFQVLEADEPLPVDRRDPGHHDLRR